MRGRRPGLGIGRAMGKLEPAVRLGPAEVHGPARVAVFSFGELLGDGLRKLPFVLALREAFPAARITWLSAGPSVYADVLWPQVAGVVERVVERLPALPRSLRGLGRFDLILDTHGLLGPHLALRLAAMGQRVAPWPWELGRRPGEHLVETLGRRLEVACGRPIRQRPSRLFLPPALEAAAAEALPPGPAYVAIAPGAGDRNRAWPLEHYLELARMQAQRGRTPVALLGPAEAGWEGAFRAIPGVVLPQGHPALATADAPAIFRTVALAARCRAGIANDAGPGHLLAAADIPLLTLFGPSEPAKARPLVTTGAVLWSRDFGGGPAMAGVPLEAADAALERLVTGAIAITTPAPAELVELSPQAALPSLA
jgi:ADP-heptose:LPS heptosyltransferase